MMPLLFFLILLVAIIVLADVVPAFHSWQSRIKIGQFANFENWKKAVAGKTIAWLNHTPTVKVTDNSRLIIIDIIRGNYKKTAIQSWQQGALLLGLCSLVKQAGSESAEKEIQKFIASRLDGHGNWKTPIKEIDEILLAYAIWKTPQFDAVQSKAALDSAYGFIRKNTGTDGSIIYRRHLPNYRFVDTIGFVAPFLVRYGIQQQDEKAVTLGLNQIAEFDKYGMLPGTFLPAHTYEITEKLPVGLFGWARGLAWYAIGLTDSWLELPENHPRKSELTQRMVRLSQTAMRFQKGNGSWSWLVLEKEKQSDSSATAVLCWFLGEAKAIAEISAACEAAQKKALDYLQTVTRRDGAIDFSQGDTKGIGVYSQKFDILPFTQGFCLRATCN